MIIPILSGESTQEGQLPEWAMVELQGEIVRKDGDPNAGGYDLGSFSVSKTGNIQLTIGYHQLEGVEQKLKKPYAIIQKSEDNSSYIVVGYITKKYLFKQRPRALISKPPQS
jgi:chromosome transmission fidelity protein 8